MILIDRGSIDLNGKVELLEYGVRVIPLVAPYHLSFVSLYEYQCVWVKCVVSGQAGVGEAVPLPGYGWETVDSIVDTIAKIAKSCITVGDLYEICEREYKKAPFAVSAILTALEQPYLTGAIESVNPCKLNYAISSSESSVHLERELTVAKEFGYTYIKLKVGRNIEDDIFSLKHICGSDLSRGMMLSLDANQAYKKKEVARILPVLEEFNNQIQWLEQPFATGDWGSVEWFTKNHEFPLFLDESIYDIEDIKRANDLGVNGIKLKLSKCFGIFGTLDLIEKAKLLGVDVLFGNGVASDVGNYNEFLISNVAGNYLVEPSESSGFIKLRESILYEALRLNTLGEVVFSNFQKEREKSRNH